MAATVSLHGTKRYGGLATGSMSVVPIVAASRGERTVSGVVRTGGAGLTRSELASEE